jgi:hypothetical protein
MQRWQWLLPREVDWSKSFVGGDSSSHVEQELVSPFDHPVLLWDAGLMLFTMKAILLAITDEFQ